MANCRCFLLHNIDYYGQDSKWRLWNWFCKLISLGSCRLQPREYSVKHLCVSSLLSSNLLVFRLKKTNQQEGCCKSSRCLHFHRSLSLAGKFTDWMFVKWFTFLVNYLLVLGASMIRPRGWVPVIISCLVCGYTLIYFSWIHVKLLSDY